MSQLSASQMALFVGLAAIGSGLIWRFRSSIKLWMQYVTVSRLALAFAILAFVLFLACAPKSTDELEKSLTSGEASVLALTLALWGVALGAFVGAYVRPVPRAAWLAIVLSGLVILLMLAALHL